MVLHGQGWAPICYRRLGQPLSITRPRGALLLKGKRIVVTGVLTDEPSVIPVGARKNETPSSTPIRLRRTAGG